MAELVPQLTGEKVKPSVVELLWARLTEPAPPPVKPVPSVEV